MTTDNINKAYQIDESVEKKDNGEGALPPDPETLHTTDPQENMKGPISSLVHKVEKKVENMEGNKPEEENKDKA